MYDFDELEKQINNVTRKQNELKKEDERLLEDAEKRLSDFFPQMYKLANLYSMVKDTTFNTEAKYSCIKCSNELCIYNFVYYDPQYTDAFSEYKSVYVRVNLEKELDKAVSIESNDDAFPSTASSRKLATELLCRFADCYPLYEEKMASNLKEWVNEQTEILEMLDESPVKPEIKKSKRVRKERL